MSIPTPPTTPDRYRCVHTYERARLCNPRLKRLVCACCTHTTAPAPAAAAATDTRHVVWPREGITTKRAVHVVRHDTLYRTNNIHPPMINALFSQSPAICRTFTASFLLSPKRPVIDSQRPGVFFSSDVLPTMCRPQPRARKLYYEII